MFLISKNGTHQALAATFAIERSKRRYVRGGRKPRLRWREPARPKRQGTSTARLMPMRGPVNTSTGAAPAGAASTVNGAASSGRP